MIAKWLIDEETAYPCMHTQFKHLDVVTVLSRIFAWVTCGCGEGKHIIQIAGCICTNCKIAKYICQNHTVLTRIFTCDFEGGRCCVRGNELLVGLRGWTQKVKSGRTSFLIVGWQKSRKLDLLRMTRVCSSYILYLISDQIWFLYHLMLFHCCLLVLHDFQSKASEDFIINLI